MTRRASIALAAAAATALAGSTAAAHPVVIADGRMEELRGTVAVGRGYGILSNTIYGACLRGAADDGDTSYDLDFSLVSLRSQADIDELDADGQRFVRTQMEHLAREQRTYQAMLAQMRVTTRTQPLDETKHTLAPGVAELLDTGRSSAFVAICGSHYVRSLRRRSSLYVLFTYEAAGADVAFEQDLADALRSFDLDAAQSSAERASDAAIDALAAERGLRITALAVGMKAQPDGAIPFDMATYRKMLDDGFRGTQHDVVGIPDEMDVVPWMSYPLLASTWLQNMSSADLDPYVTREIVWETAEQYLELLARVSDVQTRVTKAGRCRRHLEEVYLRDGRLRRTFEATYVRSHRRKSGRVLPLAQLAATLAPANLAMLEQQAAAYIHGLDANREPTSPLGRCIAQLEQHELTVRPVTIPECTQLAEPFTPEAEAVWRVIDEYCFPEIAPPLPAIRAGGLPRESDSNTQGRITCASYARDPLAPSRWWWPRRCPRRSPQSPDRR